MAEQKVKLYNFEGKEIGEEILEPSLFAVPVDPEVVQQVAVAQAKNSRQVLAHTKGRGEVRGGGRKPWQQKGTGRARHGSIRSPLWIGGGVTFGPTNQRNFSVKVNKKLKIKALTMALSDKALADKLILMDSYDLPEPKTALLNKVLVKLPSKNKQLLIVTKDSKSNVVRASKNLPKITTIGYNSLNVIDLLRHEYLMLNKELVNKIKEFYL